MLFRARHGDSEYNLTLRDRSISITRDDAITVASDRAGRLYSYFREGVMNRRALNGQVIRKWHEGPARSPRGQPGIGEARNRWLDPRETDALVNEAAAFVRAGTQASGSPGWTWQAEPPDPATMAELRRLLWLAAQFDAAAAARDVNRFQEVYSSVGILPPDHYLSLVLQATDGCSFDTCAFCDLYDRPYRVRTPAGFRSHIEAVRAYFGDGLGLRERTVFLGAANALAVPMPRLVDFFEEIGKTLGRPPRGIHAFVDGFTGQRKSVDDYRQLAELGLKRVYIGLESGHDPLLEFVRKPARASQVLETVARIKAAGVHVAAIVIVGLGGAVFAEGHVRDTVRTLNAMDLSSGDLVFLSDMVQIPGTPYARIAAERPLHALGPEELAAQRRSIISGLEFSGPPPKVATYDIREFIY